MALQWNRLFPLQALGVSSDHHGQSVPRSVHPAGLCLSAAPHPARFSEAGPIPMPSSVCQQPGVPMTYTKFPCLTHIRNCQHFSTKEGNFSHGLGSLFIRHICSRANTGEGSKKTFTVFCKTQSSPTCKFSLPEDCSKRIVLHGVSSLIISHAHVQRHRCPIPSGTFQWFSTNRSQQHAETQLFTLEGIRHRTVCISVGDRRLS